MKIIDNNNLIPDKEILKKIVREHPFSKNLDSRINTLIIELLPSQATSETSKLNFGNNDVILSIFRTTPEKNNYKYILYHEFGHIADQFNPEFEYTEEGMNSLTNNEKLKVEELWNAYIDARLNDKNLLQVGNNDNNMWGTINGKPQKNSI